VWIAQVAPGYLGGSQTALHPLGSLEDHLYACDEAGLKVLFAAPAYAERAAELLERSDSLERVLTFGPAAVGADLMDLVDRVGATRHAIPAKRSTVLTSSFHLTSGSVARIGVSVASGDHVEAADHLADVLKVRATALPPEMRALVRSMLTMPEASEAVRHHLDERIGNLAAGIGGADAELRAAIAVSSILGLTVARHFLQLRAVSSVSDDDLVRVASQAITAGLQPKRSC